MRLSHNRKSRGGQKGNLLRFQEINTLQFGNNVALESLAHAASRKPYDVLNAYLYKFPVVDQIHPRYFLVPVIQACAVYQLLSPFRVKVWKIQYLSERNSPSRSKFVRRSRVIHNAEHNQNRANRIDHRVKRPFVNADLLSNAQRT